MCLEWQDETEQFIVASSLPIPISHHRDEDERRQYSLPFSLERIPLAVEAMTFWNKERVVRLRIKIPAAT